MRRYISESRLQYMRKHDFTISHFPESVRKKRQVLSCPLKLSTESAKRMDGGRSFYTIGLLKSNT